VVVGIELEEEVRKVNEDEDDRGTSTELEEIWRFKIAIDSPIQPFVLSEASGAAGNANKQRNTYECCGDYQSNDRDRHQRRIQLSGHGLELLGTKPKSTDWVEMIAGKRRCAGREGQTCMTHR
jgi:hypothetical protein